MLYQEVEEIASHEVVLHRTKSYFKEAYKKYPKLCAVRAYTLGLALNKKKITEALQKDFPKKDKLWYQLLTHEFENI